MAIYIIKFGVLPLKKKEPKRATCGRCQTVFLFEDEDIAASMDDGTDVIKCPLCTNDVFYQRPTKMAFLQQHRLHGKRPQDAD